MKISDWIENVALENKSSDYAQGPTGRVWWNTTTGQAKVDDGTNIRALLRNDAKTVVGNSGTTSQNIRLHRGAAGVLQFVTGDDATAEGTLSTTLNKVSSRLENYTNATRPAAGNAGRTIWNTDTVTEQVDNGATWQEVSATAPTTPADASNYTLTGSVAANALTIALKTAAVADPSSGDPVKIAFRDSTSATGTYSVVSATAATSVVVASGATLGHTSAVAQYIYVWALNNAGTIELAVSGSRNFDELSTYSTTIMSGSATDWETLYSTTARTSKAIRFLGRISSTQAAAGTYVTAVSEISLLGKFQPRDTTPWVTDTNFSFANFGSVTANLVKTRRVGDTLEVNGTFKSGTNQAANAQITLPSYYRIDSTKLSTTANTSIVGNWINTNTTTKFSADLAGPLFFDGSTLDNVYMSVQASASGSIAAFNANVLSNTTGFHFKFAIPVKEFRSL